MNLLELILTDYTLQVVSLGSALLGIVSGVLGSFAVIRKESLLGDAISHAALPGITIAFLLTQTKNTEILLLGALISGLIATLLIFGISNYTRIKFDSALGLILSVFFGAGLVMLTYIQRIPNANQAGLDKFIFGQASTLLLRDVKLIALVGSVLLALVVLFWKEFKIVSFDRAFAESLGFNTERIVLLLSFMIVTSIIIGLQTVGVILMSAMITSPAVAARQWTDKLSVMVILSAVFGAISGIGGTLISSVIPRLPTGPMIVVFISAIVIISLGFAPNRGLVFRYIRYKKNQRNVNREKILINLYELAMKHDKIGHGHHVLTIDPDIGFDKIGRKNLEKQLENFKSKGLADKDYEDKWYITEKGIEYVKKYILEGEM